MLRAGFALALGAALLAGCGAPRPAGPSDQIREAFLQPVAKPGDIVAAELAFARMALEDGQYTAFREFAATGAIMFTPQMVDANEWLNKRDDPALSPSWEPYEVWSSCDGSVGVTRGGWQKGDRKGWYTTVWQRQRDGSQRWLLDHAWDDETVPGPPELIEAHIAECPQEPWNPTEELVVAVPGEGDFFGGASDDKTLRWGGRADRWGGRIVTVDVWNGEAYQRVLHQTVAPPAKD